MPINYTEALRAHSSSQGDILLEGMCIHYLSCTHCGKKTVKVIVDEIGDDFSSDPESPERLVN